MTLIKISLSIGTQNLMTFRIMTVSTNGTQHNEKHNTDTQHYGKLPHGCQHNSTQHNDI
jgi:hypothetical protein